MTSIKSAHRPRLTIRDVPRGRYSLPPRNPKNRILPRPPSPQAMRDLPQSFDQRSAKTPTKTLGEFTKPSIGQLPGLDEQAIKQLAPVAVQPEPNALQSFIDDLRTQFADLMKKLEEIFGGAKIDAPPAAPSQPRELRATNNMMPMVHVGEVPEPGEIKRGSLAFPADGWPSRPVALEIDGTRFKLDDDGSSVAVSGLDLPPGPSGGGYKEDGTVIPPGPKTLVPAIVIGTDGSRTPVNLNVVNVH